MKKYIIMLSALAVLCGCQHDIAREVDYNITLSAENTYLAGEPVVFNIAGEVDNLLFYSGEPGADYECRERTQAPMSSVTDIKLYAEYQARYSVNGHLEVWVTDDFDGLTFIDPAADSSAFASIAADPAKAGWIKLDYEEGKSEKWTQQEYQLTNLKDFDVTSDKLCLAFHWCPPDPVKNQRAYWLSGSLEFECEGQKVSKTYKDLAFRTISLNDDTCYDAKTYNGCKFDFNTKDAQIALTGYSATEPYKWDLWLVSTPFKVLPIDPDKGTVIKNVQNSMDFFEYTWNEPGTYTVTFVGTCANYLGSSKQVKTMTVNIVEEVENPL